MKKKAIMILAALCIACTAAGCSSREGTMDFAEDFYQTEEQVVQETELYGEEEYLGGLLETGPVDVDQLPSVLEPIPGYYPYVLRYYNQDGELIQNMVPGFVVDEKRYTIQEAIKKDVITGVAAYTAEGEPCKVVDLARVVDRETGTFRLTGSAVYVFYVKEGLDIQVAPYRGEDLVMAGDLNNFSVYWGNAMREEFGYGWVYQICNLASQAGSGSDGTVGVIQDSVMAVSGPSASSGISHYYWYLTGETFETVEMGGI